MVARGDLGVEMDGAVVPYLQKLWWRNVRLLGNPSLWLRKC